MVDGVGNIWRGDLIETSRVSGVRWHVTVRVWEAIEDGHFTSILWVDNEVVGDGLDVTRIPVMPPRIVGDLLSGGAEPKVGSIRLWSTAESFAGTEVGRGLADYLTDPERTVPFVVIHDTEESRRAAMRRSGGFDAVVHKAAGASMGLANVVVVDDAAARELTDRLGRPLGLWGGAMRIYGAVVDLDEPGDSYRHRYFTADRFASGRVDQLIGNRLGPLSTVRRAPTSYTFVRERLRSHDGSALDELIDDEIDRLTAEVSALKDELQREREYAEDSALELAEVMESNAQHIDSLERARGHLSSLRAQLKAADTYIEATEDAPPPSVSSVLDLVDMVRLYFEDTVVLPDGVCRDLDQIDATTNGVAWAGTSWRAFRALDAFVRDIRRGWSGGGFWEWCANSGNLRAWPATSKKLAMVESSHVQTSDKLWASRLLPVGRSVSSTGKIHMMAHLKIAEGGGPMAPRIYFHIAGTGEDTTVHVGFFGPHKYMPNKKTN